MGSRTETLEENPSYKYQWARQVLRDKLPYDTDNVIRKLKALDPSGIPSDVDRISTPTGLVTSGIPIGKVASSLPEPPGKFKVGIVGAGCAGLFTAMILDHINKEIPGLNIEYDILEAADEDRLGGRLYTHSFSGNKKDYYDVGAMRFPKIPIMERYVR